MSRSHALTFLHELKCFSKINTIIVVKKNLSQKADDHGYRKKEIDLYSLTINLDSAKNSYLSKSDRYTESVF